MNESNFGFLLIDKPAGITSHDVVDRLRRITGLRKIGHAGTLDPFATGLLVVGIGREATRRLGEMSGKDKEYEATAVLGATSNTQDLTGAITPTTGSAPMPTADPKDKTVTIPFAGTEMDGEGTPLPTVDAIRRASASFIGPISQIPPMFSAKKIGGKKLYELARTGQEVARQPIQLTVHSLEIINYSPPRLSFRVRCSAGTYIRTLAHDLGQALGCGAYLESLRRTKSGNFDVSSATPLDQLTPENWRSKLK